MRSSKTMRLGIAVRLSMRLASRSSDSTCCRSSRSDAVMSVTLHISMWTSRRNKRIDKVGGISLPAGGGPTLTRRPSQTSPPG